MSFFGFDTNLPRERGHPANAPGFGQAPDPFAAIARPNTGQQDEDDDDDDALDFEETYDGLGDQLDETDDTFNDDTFGGDGPAKKKPVGKDFDFFGQTAQVSTALEEEQLRYSRQQVPSKSVGAIAASPPKPIAKPAKTGYEKYKEPGYIPDLQANASLWGVPTKKPVNDPGVSHQRQQSYGTASSQPPSTARKMMSLEEVEAAMRAQSKKRASGQGPPPAPEPMQSFQPPSQPQPAPHQPQILRQPHPSQEQVPVMPQHPSFPPPLAQQPPQGPGQAQLSRTEPPFVSAQQPAQILQRQQPPPPEQPGAVPPTQPRQILQNPNRKTPPSRQPGSEPHELPQSTHSRPTSMQGPPPGQATLVTHPQQLLQLSEEERAAFLIEDAKRAKRNHKIYLLSKDNGLMTPQDKNFITRIQLQQLVTATGNPSQADPDAALAEDFYYQVHSQIQGGPRQNPHQPLNHFAQTYLFQTGGRQGVGTNRRLNRTGDNHMQRMAQQVQRAVEAAKLKPKNKQLVIEGSLGKISFSNAKTPKPLLNIKRGDSGDAANRPRSGARNASERKGQQSGVSASGRKAVLRQIEAVYSVLMQMEDHERHLRPPPSGADPSEERIHMEWSQAMHELNEKLWINLKVTDPIIPNSPVPHPFIAFLTFAKGKKAIPRIFRHIDPKQRVTILTMIVVHLGLLDVVRLAQLQAGEHQLPSAVREEVELFSQAVMPSLFGYVNEAPLNIVIGLFGILLDSVDVHVVARSKVGLSVLTMFLSRAELLKQEGSVDDGEWEHWVSLYNRLFDGLEPILGQIFPGSINSGEDMYVWQFLAAMGLCAGPEQQQRLVMAVKDRVMETVTQSKTLPPQMSAQRLGNVNLFMRAIGLDVELLG